MIEINKYFKTYLTNAKPLKYVDVILESGGAFPNQYKLCQNMWEKNKDRILINPNKIREHSFFEIIDIDNEQVQFEIYVELIPSYKDYGKGSTNYNTHGTPRIELNLEFTNIESIKSTFVTTLAHELLHLYENIKRINRNKETIFDKAKKSGYFQWIDFLNNDDIDVSLFFRALYLCQDYEINAYVSMTYKELEEKGVSKKYFKDSLIKTKSYSFYYNLLYNIIPKLEKIDYGTMLDIKMKFFESLNKDVDFKLTNEDVEWYKRMINNFKNRATKALKKIIKNASMYYFDLNEGKKMRTKNGII